MTKTPKVELYNVKLNSAVLNKIAKEAAAGLAGNVAAFDSYVKTSNCSIHGKGNHIKGDGPNNYLKDSAINLDPGNVIKDYATLVNRLSVDVAGKIKGAAANKVTKDGG